MPRVACVERARGRPLFAHGGPRVRVATGPHRISICGDYRFTRVLLESNGGSVFEPPFDTAVAARRRAARRDSACGGADVPRGRFRRGRHARHRPRRRVVAREPLPLLQGQGRTALLLPGPIARSPARGARAGNRRSRRPGDPAPRPRGRARAVPARRCRRIGRAPGRGRAPAAVAARDRRQARSLRTRRPRARRRSDRDARLPRRAQLDGSLVPPRRTGVRGGGCRTGGGVCRRRTRPPCHTPTSR